MVDNDTRDPATGLLDRRAFLQEVHKVQNSTPTRLRRGCLLIMSFPILQSLAQSDGGEEALDDALRHLLAIVETRVRTRDPLGRIAPHSLSLLLKACRESDAVVVADQYVALLRDVVVQCNGRQVPLDLRYRIVPLDARGSKPRQGVSRLVVAPSVSDHLTLAKQIEVAGNRVDLTSSKVVALNAARAVKKDLPSADNDNPGETEPADPARGSGIVVEIGSRSSSQSWRLRPGMLIARHPLICCFWLHTVGVARMSGSLQKTDLFASVLAALALNNQQTRPVVESQLIVPIEASQLDVEFAKWVSAQCQAMRVSPSDICLSLNVESLTKVLRDASPVLRQLNRIGIRLLLQGVVASSQFRMIKSIAQFDYLYVSGRQLKDSMESVAERVEVQSIIDSARKQNCEICAGGIDSKALFDHALAMNVEIGFGRQCGASIAFPEQAWTTSDSR